jgi:predicted Zn-ribbon and HTH transcriptional regulator
MYNEQLEQLIDAALADGVLTEKEKQILFKKAQTLGIDLDEFEMVLDARLVKLQKEQQAAAPKSNKYGDVRKCPACGALVPSLSGICQECGYEFSGVDANLSSKALNAKIEEINEQLWKDVMNPDLILWNDEEAFLNHLIRKWRGKDE